MLHISFRSRLSWAAALLMVVALGAADSAFAASATATRALSSELPSGVTLGKATFSQTKAALSSAVSKNQKAAAALVGAAIASKSSKFTVECAQVRGFVKAATEAAPEQASSISESAAAERPDCAGGVGDDLAPRTGGIIGTVGDQPVSQAQGFGAGLGSGFAGSPGFIGSAPSGGFTFPPVVINPVTSVVNP